MISYCLAVRVIFGINQEKTLKLDFTQRHKYSAYVLHYDSGKYHLIRCWGAKLARYSGDLMPFTRDYLYLTLLNKNKNKNKNKFAKQ